MAAPKTKLPFRLSLNPERRFAANFRAKSPPILYHYTSQEALLGIIQNKSIWATDVRFLNDLKEYNHAVDFASDTLRSIASKSRRHGIHELCEEIIRRLVSAQDTAYFTFSLSEHGDSLNQWRSYTARGPGYAIGFSTQELEWKCEEQRYLFGKCLYDTLTIESAIFELTENYVAGLSGYFPYFGKGEINEDLIQTRSRNFVRLFMGYAGFLKHPAFSEEAEWRVIIDRPAEYTSDIHIRHGNHSLIPYLKVDFKDIDFFGAIRRIIIKPTPHAKLVECGLRIFLDSQIGQLSMPVEKIEPIEIQHSSVPYRE